MVQLSQPSCGVSQKQSIPVPVPGSLLEGSLPLRVGQMDFITPVHLHDLELPKSDRFCVSETFDAAIIADEESMLASLQGMLSAQSLNLAFLRLLLHRHSH
jgi:hypothetical protein